MREFRVAASTEGADFQQPAPSPVTSNMNLSCRKAGLGPRFMVVADRGHEALAPARRAGLHTLVVGRGSLGGAHVTVMLRPLAYADLLGEVFDPIAIGGASSFAFSSWLQKAFAALVQDAVGSVEITDALKVAAREAAGRTRKELVFQEDKAAFPRELEALRPLADASRRWRAPPRRLEGTLLRCSSSAGAAQGRLPTEGL